MRKRLVKVGLPLLVAIALVVGLPFLTSASSADAIFGPVNNMSSESTATAYAVATQSEVLPVPANGNGLALSWLANNDDNHLALDPSNNARQEHRMLLEFTLPGDGVFAAGEVEIRLPRAFFEDRDGNFIVGNIDSGAHGVDPHMLPHFYIPLPGPTDFDYTIDEANDEVVIANFRPVQGGTTHLSLTMDIRYSPWNVPNGFTNEFSALATFAASTGQTPIESNSLSLDLTTRVVRVDPEKRAMQAYPVWQQAWGARPAGTDDHFFVRYRIFELATTATTQPFTLHIQDTPLDSGKIVGWTQLNSSLSGIQFPTGQINLGNFWTLGNTADFNNHADRTWTSHVPWFQEVGQSNLHRIQDVIVAYPRTGQPDQLVRNTIQIVFTPVADSDSASTTYNREGSWVFNDSYLNYAGNHFAVNKWMNGNNLVLPNLLDFLAAGEPAVFNRFGLGGGTGFGNVFGLPDVHIGINGPMALAQVRAFDATNGGTQPFTTTLIDDHVYLRTSTGQHLLNPEDFRFTSVGIHHYVELIPFVSSTGGILDVQRVPDRDRSPISIYYKAQSGGGWQYFETFSFADQFFRHENLPDLDIYRIKAVHDNGRYVTLFSMSFEIQLNPTPRVLSLIQGQETVSVVNFAAMIVEDHAGNLLNVATEEHYATGWPSYLMTQDIVDYGHLVQRAENYVRIGRTSYRAESEKVIRSSGIVSDSANARVVFPYRLFAFQDIGSQGVSGQTSFPRPSDALLAELLSEQTEGVFYDLLPQGMIIDPASIVARDARGRIVDHVLMTEANWQDSGRTMVSIYVSATAGTNLRNNASMPSSLNDIMYLSGTGFSVDFDLFYPWANAAIFGMTDIRNIAAYQSRSGAFLNPITEGNPHTNANNTATVFNAQEQAQMANFPRTDAVNSAERNTKSMLHVANIDPATSDQVGFSKHVRAAADLDYVMETTLRPGTAYSYRLRFSPAMTDVDVQVRNLVMFDVLESADSGRPNWRGNLQSVDVAHPISLGAAPIVHFSTQSGLDPMNNTAHADLTNTAIWTTIEPANLNTVTAVAIDLSVRDDGQPFIIAPGSGVIVNLHMRAPHDAISETHAFNTAMYRITTVLGAGSPTDWPLSETPYTQIEILGRELSLAKSSNPISGTQAAPTVVEAGDTVTYSIVVENAEEAALEYITLQDVIPAGMNFTLANVTGHFGTATPAPLADIARVSAHSLTGNTLTWTLANLGADETFTLLVGVTIDQGVGEATFANTARITHLGTISYDIVSNTTFHRTAPFVIPAGLSANGIPISLVVMAGAILTVYFTLRARRRIDELADSELKPAKDLA